MNICRTLLAKSTGLLNFCSARCYKFALLNELASDLEIKSEEASSKKLISGQVLVSVRSAGVNYADWRLIYGHHQVKLALPGIPGFEFSGEVKDKAEDVKSFSIGDRVLGLKTDSRGAFAEECLADQKELYPIPHTLSYEMAASLPVPYGTAMLALEVEARVKEGEKVLVLTSHGSTGIAAIDLAMHVHQCLVYTASNTEEKSAVLRPRGVMATVNYEKENMVKEIRKHTDGEGVDLIIDTVGGHWFNEALQCLKPGGRICSVDFSSGQIPAPSLLDLSKYQASVHGIWLHGFAKHNPDGFHRMIETIIKLLDEQYIDPFIGKEFALDEVNEALRHVADKSTMGKTVLRIAQ